MAKNILVDLNLNQNEIQNVAIQNLSADPSNAIKGQVYFNTSTNRFRVFNGTTWDEMGKEDGTVKSVAAENASNGGLTITGSPITSSGTFVIGHTNVLGSAQTTQGIYPIKYDKNGHITAAGTAFDPATKQNALNATQMNAVNSGITSSKVSTYDGYASQIAGKQNIIEDLDTIREGAAAGATALQTESDPIFTTSPAHGIQNTDISNWNGKQDKINDLTDIREGAALGKTSVQTESDPVFSASAAATITSANISTWNGKQDVISDLSAIRSGAALGSTSVQPADLTPYAKLVSPAFTGNPTAPTQNQSDNSTKLATTAFVKTAIDALPEPMVFKGTVGTGGTIAWSALPTASEHTGWTYKVIEKHTTAPICAVGDTIISNGTDWIVVPSGDEPAGTVTSVGLQNSSNGGLTITGSPITSSGTISVGHTNVLANAQATQAVYPIAIDKNGHISSYGSAQTILRKYVGTITGNGTLNSFTLNHNLGSRDVIVQVYDGANYDEVLVDIYRTDTNNVKIEFNKAPISNKIYKVVVIG